MFGFIDSLSSTFGLGQFFGHDRHADHAGGARLLPAGPDGQRRAHARDVESVGRPLDFLELPPRQLFYASSGAFFCILIVLPSSWPLYLQDALVLFVVNAILVMSYRLITTMGGWSFAHIAMMAIGSYTMAMLTTAYAAFRLAHNSVGGDLRVSRCLRHQLSGSANEAVLLFLSTFAAAKQFASASSSSRTCSAASRAYLHRPPEPVFGLSFYTTPPTTTSSRLIFSHPLWRDHVRIRQEPRRANGQSVAANENLSEAAGMNTWRYRLSRSASARSSRNSRRVLQQLQRFVAPTNIRPPSCSRSSPRSSSAAAAPSGVPAGSRRAHHHSGIAARSLPDRSADLGQHHYPHHAVHAARTGELRPADGQPLRAREKRAQPLPASAARRGKQGARAA